MMLDEQCPLCGFELYTPLTLGEPVARTGQNVLCHACGLIYHAPLPSSDELALFYAQNYAESYTASEVISRELAQIRITYIQQWIDIKSPCRVLEIGCAKGEFLDELQHLGCIVEGAEPSEVMSQHCREQYGLPVHTGMYADAIDADNHYDLIALFHVLEHMPDALAMLQRMRRHLNPRGILCLEVPTLGQCQLAMVFKAIHPLTFVPSTLQAMLQVAGFSILDMTLKGNRIRAVATPGPEQITPHPVDIQPLLQQVQAYVTQREAIVERIAATLEKWRTVSGGCIYGAGLSTIDLNQCFPLNTLQLDMVVDADPMKQGKSLLGLPVHAPQMLEAWQGKYIIISSFAFQHEIYAQLQHLEKKGIHLVRLYAKDEL